MKALSLWQPWASAIAVGVKRYETRHWAPRASQLAPGQLLAIHAAKTREERELFEDLLEESAESRCAFGDHLELDFDVLPFGAVVAVGVFEGAYSTSPDISKFAAGLAPSPLEQLWGNFSPKRYGWKFSQVWRLAEPFPCLGRQSLFNVELPIGWRDTARIIPPFKL